MKKNVIITISVISAVILLVALICVVFIIGDVEVLTTSELILSDEEKLNIINDSKIVKHSSIFALSEDIAIENIEKLYPSLKVVQIERKIPNKVIINVSSRVGMIAIPISEGGYWIIDRELKVVDRLDTIENGFYAITNDIIVPDDLEVGDFLDNIEWVTGIIKGAEASSFVGKRFGSFIKEITLNDNKTITLLTNTGLKFVIPFVDNDTTVKIMINQYKVYLTLNDIDRSKGMIILGEKGNQYVA